LLGAVNNPVLTKRWSLAESKFGGDPVIAVRLREEFSRPNPADAACNEQISAALEQHVALSEAFVQTILDSLFMRGGRRTCIPCCFCPKSIGLSQESADGAGDVPETENIGQRSEYWKRTRARDS
jgi:hypothetical protein